MAISAVTLGGCSSAKDSSSTSSDDIISSGACTASDTAASPTQEAWVCDFISTYSQYAPTTEGGAPTPIAEGETRVDMNQYKLCRTTELALEAPFAASFNACVKKIMDSTSPRYLDNFGTGVSGDSQTWGELYDCIHASTTKACVEPSAEGFCYGIYPTSESATPTSESLKQCEVVMSSFKPEYRDGLSKCYEENYAEYNESLGLNNSAGLTSCMEGIADLFPTLAPDELWK